MSDPVEWLKGKSAHLFVKLTAKFLARELYQGVFEREASDGEISACASAIRVRGSIAPALKSQLASIEFQNKTFAAVAPELVKAAYKGILGRETDAGGLESHVGYLKENHDIEAFLTSVIQSAEFKLINDPAIIERYIAAPWGQQPSLVEIEVTPEQLELLFNRIRDQWTTLGDTEPHWSVVTHERFKSASFSQHEEEFYNSGSSTVSLVEGAFGRAGLAIRREATVLELGCGTGRVTHVLADKFAHVIAVDVSPGNLRLCKNKLSRLGKTNVEYVLLKSPRDIERIPPIDFFFSTIVLQHNPPPVIYYFLDQILGKIRESGRLFFQVPTHSPGYTFDVAQYLASPVPAMEMHTLPMRAVFSLFEKHGMAPLEVLTDNWTGQPGSHSFFAVRK